MGAVETETGRADDPARAELVAQVDTLVREIDELNARYSGVRLPEEQKAHWNELNKNLEDVQATIAELDVRDAQVKKNASAGKVEEIVDSFQVRRPSSVVGDAIYDLTSIRPDFMDASVAGRQLRDRALKALDTTEVIIGDEMAKLGMNEATAKQNVKRILSRDAEDGRFARYLLATGNPTYKRAFPKLFGKMGAATLYRDEIHALQHVEAAERALNLTGAQGGFAVPFELDPTIMFTGAGTINPLRTISTVKNISVDEWRGVTSAGITASFVAEATEATDNAPTLVQPIISTERAHAFIPYSIEIGGDWPGLREEMAQLLAIAKDDLEASKFVIGTGTNEPFGVAVGTTNTINAAAGQTFTLANLYALAGGLPNQYRMRGSYIADLAILNRVRQFETTGGSTSGVWVEGLAAPTPGTDGRAGLLLGKPTYEASEMVDTPSTGFKFLIFGDFSRFVIVDRIGMNLELLPHLLGANRRPTGERGLYAYWRVGSKVVDANAFRALLGVA